MDFDIKESDLVNSVLSSKIQEIAEKTAIKQNKVRGENCKLITDSHKDIKSYEITLYHQSFRYNEDYYCLKHNNKILGEWYEWTEYNNNISTWKISQPKIYKTYGGK